jgi:TIR domain
MADVFISYSQRAPEPTHALASALIEHGIDAWFDVNLLPGDAFGKVLDGEIDRAKAVVTIWSRPALTSIWVPAESQRALDQGKLLCVRTTDVDAKELPTPFNRLHTPLVTDIDAILGDSPTRVCGEARRRSADSRRNTARWAKRRLPGTA